MLVSPPTWYFGILIETTRGFMILAGFSPGLGIKNQESRHATILRQSILCPSPIGPGKSDARPTPLQLHPR